MDFKKIILGLGALFSVTMLVACTGSYVVDTDDNMVGNPIKAVAALTTPDEGPATSLVMFDKTVRRIHQFELGGMKHVRSFAVRNPNEDHYVLYGNNGNYIVDMSLKGLTLFNKYNQANHQPIHFEGKPKSAAFLPSKGLVVIYDDLMSVGMLKVDSNGEVLSSWVGGSSIVGGATIAAGDLNSDGKLILALSEGSIVVIDVEQSMAQKKWVIASQFATGLSDVRWVAPLPKSPKEVLIRAFGKLALVDITTQLTISSYDIVDEVVKVSKFSDPHIVMRSDTSAKVAYVENSQIQVKTFYLYSKKFDINYLMRSNLDLAQDSWSFVDTTQRISYVYNDLDATKLNRRFVRYRFSDALATRTMSIADDSQVEIGETFIFALFPRELGYAIRYDIDTEGQSELARFNLKYIPAD